MTSVKKEIAKGVFWIALAKYSGVIVSLLVTAILARNISPAAFGTMAIANVIISFLSIFVDMGIGVAVVQFKDLDQKQLNTLFTVGAYIGIVLSLILFLGSPIVAKYYSDNVIINVCRWLCIAVMFNSLNIVPNGMMMREKRFRTVAIRSISFQVISGMLAMSAAIAGWGIYALIITPILSSIGILSVNLYNYPCKFVARLDYNVIHRVWRYSAFQFLFSFINYFSRNIDTLIIGKFFSMSQLGYYDKAYRLMQMPLQYVTFVIGPVIHPILSELQNDLQSLAQKAAKLIMIVSRISFPIGIFCYFAASSIIHIIFGDNWDAAIPVFQILAISLPLQMILSLSGALFQAGGHTNHMFYTGLINTIITIVGFLIAAFVFKTLTAMAWAWTITLGINFFTSYITMFRITFSSDVKMLWHSLLPQVVNSAIVVLMMLTTKSMVENLSDAVQFFTIGFLIMTATVVMGLILHQYRLSSIINPLIARLRR